MVQLKWYTSMYNVMLACICVYVWLPKLHGCYTNVVNICIMGCVCVCVCTHAHHGCHIYVNYMCVCPSFLRHYTQRGSRPIEDEPTTLLVWWVCQVKSDVMQVLISKNNFSESFSASLNMCIRVNTVYVNIVGMSQTCHEIVMLS